MLTLGIILALCVIVWVKDIVFPPSLNEPWRPPGGRWPDEPSRGKRT